MKNRDFFHGAFIGMAATLTGVIILQLSGTHVFSIGDGVLSHERYVKKLEYIEQMIDDQFLGEINEDDLAEGLYAGLMSGLNDPYSYYYTVKEYDDENTYSEGSYVGIGITLEDNAEGGIWIADCYEGFPGDLAGLEPGDLIVGIDGVDMTDMTPTDVVSMVRNSGKESVVVTVYKEDAKEPVDIKVVLDTVELPSVYSDMLPDQVGYIQITEFTGVTPTQFAGAMEKLRADGMEKLVVDLRNNPGGLLDSVCDTLREILPEGLIVYMEDKYGRREEFTCDGEHPLEIPLAVLVNSGSASASEVFSGAVRDHGIGILVGTKTFGKGIVQGIQQLDDGSAVKMTIANYYTPKGNNIHGIGIEPDVEVKLDEALLNRTEISYEEDNQLQEAIRILMEDNKGKEE